jgi:hypothetical protein
MPSWQKVFVLLSILSCSLTGIIYLLGHEFNIYKALLGQHSILAWHGICAILATMALGSVLSVHIKAGFHSKRKRISGFSQLGLLLLLCGSGLLLYYGPENLRDATIFTHWVAGNILLVVFLIHTLTIPKLRSSTKEKEY